MDNSANKSSEFLLSEEEGRLVTFPIKEDVIWKMYKKAISSFGHQKKLIYLKKR